MYFTRLKLSLMENNYQYDPEKKTNPGKGH
jgi:hypothetical protein